MIILSIISLPNTKMPHLRVFRILYFRIDKSISILPHLQLPQLNNLIPDHRCFFEFQISGGGFHFGLFLLYISGNIFQ